MKLVIGFITYNNLTSQYLPGFLTSLFNSLAQTTLTVNDYQILVWDNSENLDNENRNYLKTKYPEIKILGAGVNFGFGRAYNYLISQAHNDQAQYFLMLNPDLIITPSAINELLGAMENNHQLGSVVPKLHRFIFASQQLTKDIDSCGLVLRPGLNFIDLGQGEADNGQYDQAEILGPSGAAGLFRLSALEKIISEGKYFDENFFMYKEDCDLAYRLFLQGFKSQVVPTALMYHDRSVAAQGRGLWSTFRNRRQKSLAVKHWSFINQHLLYIKYYAIQNWLNKMQIIKQLIKWLILALFFEQYLLADYKKIRRLAQVYASVKPRF